MNVRRLITSLGGYPFAVLAVVAATAALLPLRTSLHPAQVMLLYVPVIVAVARVAGARASLTAALTAFLALDLAFVPPYYRFTVTSPVDWVTLLLFLLVAVVAGLQTGELRERARAALQGKRDLSLLYRLSSRLVSQESPDEMAGFVVGEVVAILGADRAALYAIADEAPVLLAEAGSPASGLGEPALADWAARADTAVALPPSDDPAHEPRPAGVPADGALPDVVADGVFVPLQTQDGVEGVLFVRPLAGHPFSPQSARQIIAVANLMAAFLERRRLEREASRVTAMRDADRLKTTLVSSVSHELKTPLAAVTARVTGLLDEGDGCDAARVREELSAVSEDLGRLDASIRDLLDLSRLESDSWRPHAEEYDISEVLGTVASRIPAANRPRVVFTVPDSLPAVRLDFAQWARALSNLVDNALAYSPPDETVRVGARVLGSDLVIWVEDRGPGVPDAEKEYVFEKFFRGAHAGLAPGGTGLGLAIAREIARSHGGGAWVEDADPSGARFVLSLPLGGGPR